MAEQDKGNLEKVGAGLGGAAGKAADTAVDLMGSMIRAAAHRFGGWWSDRSPDDAVRSFGEREESACRKHFEATRTGSSYDAMRPLYQFGHLAGQNPDYQGRSFAEVEGDLKTAWTPEQSRRHGDWGSVRDYVGAGYSTEKSV
jgi:hypothetical protein